MSARVDWKKLYPRLIAFTRASIEQAPTKQEADRLRKLLTRWEMEARQ